MKTIFCKPLLLVTIILLGWLTANHVEAEREGRPNIFFAIADDWGWPHAGVYGDPVVKTPTFDRLAREGILFKHAYVSSPSCTPSRAAILTGQYHWRLEESANLYGVLRKKFDVYPDLLERVGYVVGLSRKGWGPGSIRPERQRNPAGPGFNNFQVFIEKWDRDQPFCFWFGSSDPHRPYRKGSGAASGMKLEDIVLPSCFPDVEEVRGDVADYYWEVQRFDREVGEALALLEKEGELDRTIVVMTGDHGMPFPRCKGNLYDSGARVPLAIRWPQKVKPGRASDDFVSLTDLAPTFLEAAGIAPPVVMTGKSLLGMLRATGSGRLDPARNRVLIGKERHCPGQEGDDSGGTPMRGIRTHDYLYIRNFMPERWPAGTPHFERAYIKGAWYGDVDNGPTKTYMVDHQDDPKVKPLFELAFGKRPAEELYDCRKDPGQLVNVANDPAYATVRKGLADRLRKVLEGTWDPRIQGKGEKFDKYPYSGGIPKKPGYRPPRKAR